MANQDWSERYHQAPNLAAALLNFLRERWTKLETSKPRKLKKFLAQNGSVPWDDSFNSRSAVQEAKELQKICDANVPKIPMIGGSRAVTQADLDRLNFAEKFGQQKIHRPGAYHDWRCSRFVFAGQRHCNRV